MLPSQTVAAAAFLWSRFSDVMVNCDMNDILSALEVLPVPWSHKACQDCNDNTSYNCRQWTLLLCAQKSENMRSTSDERLSHLMLMSVERSLVKSLALDDLVDDCKIADASLSAAGVTDTDRLAYCTVAGMPRDKRMLLWIFFCWGV